MKKTEVQFPDFTDKIDYSKSVALLGSCFSQNLSDKLRNSGFTVVQNPLGVVFNPVSIANYLLYSDDQLASSIFERDGIWLSYMANGTVYELSEQAMKKRLIEERQTFRNHIASSSHLFITFGTAWVYELISSHDVVANCHKQPSAYFNKTLLSVDAMKSAWQNAISLLQAEYPSLRIVLTISPVRHTKDGMQENMLSKSRLIEFVHELKELENCEYLPVFEFFMDELRDYAWYAADGIHPNSLAVDRVWDKFRDSFFSKDTALIFDEYEQMLQDLNHRSIHPESNQAIKFKNSLRQKLDDFFGKYPQVNREVQ